MGFFGVYVGSTRQRKHPVNQTKQLDEYRNFVLISVIDIRNKRKSAQINWIICKEESSMSSKRSGLHFLCSKNHWNNVCTEMLSLNLGFRKIIEGWTLDGRKLSWGIETSLKLHNSKILVSGLGIMALRIIVIECIDFVYYLCDQDVEKSKTRLMFVT